ncbi:MAG: hypothetical protein MUF38_19105, partial [Anaerolineae bacterium]|nr:hypothetical protein [Anaerolineae bacterium]
MNDNLHDTKPRPAVQVPTEPQRPAPTQPLPPYPRPHQPNYDEGVPAPPRFLLWGVVIAFVLGIMTVIGGVVAFRFVLEPAQQERVMQ